MNNIELIEKYKSRVEHQTLLIKNFKRLIKENSGYFDLDSLEYDKSTAKFERSIYIEFLKDLGCKDYIKSNPKSYFIFTTHNETIKECDSRYLMLKTKAKYIKNGCSFTIKNKVFDNVVFTNE